jgi:gliding motility-associated-like protein
MQLFDYHHRTNSIFSYHSPGNECIKITTSGTTSQAGIGVYDQCPAAIGATCIANAPPGFNTSNPTIDAAFLPNAGYYYIVFGSGINCSSFNIQVDTVTCPPVLPIASSCDKALDIGGCSNKTPVVIPLIPGTGDLNLISQGINQGCFVATQFNYSFFYFKAEANGKFGFVVEAADPDEASDIDFSLWGPIDAQSNFCNFVKTQQPVRSSWTDLTLPTGLVDINPETGAPVLDDYDCGSPGTPSSSGDRYVRRLDVIQGKYYVILLDDYSNTIHHGGFSVDFSGTTDNVFHPADGITVTKDTAICAGQQVHLSASGGASYFWSPSTSLNCINCQNPVSTPAHGIIYDVKIVATCKTESRHVNIQVANLNLGPDITVCGDAVLTLNPHPDTIQGSDYNWTGSPGLSCNDCPNPTLTGLTVGNYSYQLSQTALPCTLIDAINITVLNGQQPQYHISRDTSICPGQSVSIGGPAIAGTTYSWSSSPPGFISNNANPGVSPTHTTKYYVTVSNGSCVVSALDSITVHVFKQPLPTISGPSTLCSGMATLSSPGNFDNWAWSNNQTNFTAQVGISGTYTVTVTDANGCTASASKTVGASVPAPTPAISGPTGLCSGTATLQVIGSDFNAQVWSDHATSSIITVNTPGTYTVTVTNASGCTAIATAPVASGAPAPMPGISGFTLFCPDSTTTLTATPGYTYEWSSGQSTASLAVGTAGTYTVTVTNNFGCTGSASIHVSIASAPIGTANVIDASCGKPNGSVNLTVTGPSPFTYLWNNGNTTKDLTGVSANTYTVTITGNYGCTKQLSATVNNLNGPNGTTQVIPASCGLSNGTVNLTLSGGLGPYAFIWNNGATLQNLTGVKTGAYAVTITDTNGCTAVASATVAGPPALAWNGLVYDCGGTDTQYTVSFTLNGGTPPYSVVTGSGSFAGNIFTSAPIASGTSFSISIGDNAGCPPVVVNGIHQCNCTNSAGTMKTQANLVACGTDSVSAVFNQNQTLASGSILLFVLHQGSGASVQNPIGWNTIPKFAYTPGILYGTPYYISAVAGKNDGNGGIDLNAPCLSVSAGTPVYFYQVYNNTVNKEICTGETVTVCNQAYTTAGSYTVHCQSKQGCDSVVTLNLVVRAPMVSLGTDKKICPGDSVLLTALSTGCSGCQYSWGAPTREVQPPSTANFTVTITDNHGCTATDEITVQVLPTKSSNLEARVCKGDKYTLGGKDFSVSGQYDVTIPASNGCDSIVHLHLDVLEPNQLKALPDKIYYPPGSGASSKEFDVLGNDSIGSLQRVAVEIISNAHPEVGNAEPLGNGSVQFMLDDTEFRGIDTLLYRICDSVCPVPCSSAKMFIIIQDDIDHIKDLLPNVFTPNGDKPNEFFDPLAEYAAQGYQVDDKTASLTIINRWGEVIFNASPYMRWDGKNQHSKHDMPVGTYYFRLVMEIGKTILVEGAVLLLR